MTSHQPLPPPKVRSCSHLFFDVLRLDMYGIVMGENVYTGMGPGMATLQLDAVPIFWY